MTISSISGHFPSPSPPLPSPHTTSMTMQFQLWREGRHRQGGAELDAAVARSGGVPWCLALFHSTIPKNANHTETCLRPPLPFSKPSTYWDLALPFDEHALVLRCRSCLCCYVCTGCHQSTQLIFGVRFCFSVCVDFQPKYEDWIIPLTFRSLQHLTLTFLRGMQLNTKAAKLSSYEPKHACWLQSVCTFSLSAAFSMPHFRVLAADFPLCCTHFIWRLARWAIQPRSAPRRQNFTTF